MCASAFPAPTLPRFEESSLFDQPGESAVDDIAYELIYTIEEDYWAPITRFVSGGPSFMQQRDESLHLHFRDLPWWHVTSDKNLVAPYTYEFELSICSCLDEVVYHPIRSTRFVRFKEVVDESSPFGVI